MMWYLLYSQYWFKWFSHRFHFFQLYWALEGLKSETLCEAEVLSKQKTEVLAFSVMLTGPHCQSDRAAHQTRAPTLLSRTEGAAERCQIIWQAKWDIFIRSSTPSQTDVNVSWGNPSPLQTSAIETRPACPFSQCFFPDMFPIHFPCRPHRSHQLHNESQAFDIRFWEWIWKK